MAVLTAILTALEDKGPVLDENDLAVLTAILTALEDNGAALDENDKVVLRGFGGLLVMVGILLVKREPLLLEDTVHVRAGTTLYPDGTI